MVVSTRYVLRMTQRTLIKEQIARLARLDSAAKWAGDLNPTQCAAISYLGRANRFSRSPSHLADYLGTTRGTVSQTLKSLLQKGYVSEQRSEADKRVISYELTSRGQSVADDQTPLDLALGALTEEEQQLLQHILTRAMRSVLAHNRGQEFGPCRTCIHHRQGTKGAECALLSVALTEQERDQICYEQVSA